MEITSSNSQFSDSGSVEVYTGNGGDIILNTGASLDRIPGAIRLQSGGGEEIGGNVLIAAGEALNTASTGGSVVMSAGVSQGHGGEFSLTGGHSLGSNSESSGGTVEIYGGTALSSKGGNVKLISGETVASGSSSGSIDLVSSPSSMTGSINIISGIAGEDKSGSLNLSTGNAKSAAGDIVLQVGNSYLDNSEGGSVKIASGDSTGFDSLGGSIHLKSGSSESFTSGGIIIESPDVTSSMTSVPSGSIAIETGHANKASGSSE